jgi:hypothetical protein
MRLRHLAAIALTLAAPQLAAAQSAPAASSEAIEPARLEAAKRVAWQILPEGIYAKVMQTSMDAMIKPMTDAVGDLPLAQLARIGGLEEEEVAGLGTAKLKEMMAIVDPAYEQRIALMTKSMTDSMIKMMAMMEPSVREGLVKAFARRYTLEQLLDLDRFFQTPTGQKFAADTMMIYTDPEVIAAMQAMMPVMIEQMPAMMQAAEADLAALPKAKQWEDLSKADKEKLARLLGTTVTAFEARRARQGNSD